ncbi:hypothetical protein XELAEV_18002105mg [Xenopus laevis]|uniref:Uncharacterized protein n=1 Tax=Xenopus laevis TaxID=8355 RepID=A0A974BNL8_XENLA|nr:hypothetical protein XELAEV_18002105mg [Xenopus laevis]
MPTRGGVSGQDGGTLGQTQYVIRSLPYCRYRRKPRSRVRLVSRDARYCWFGSAHRSLTRGEISSERQRP